MTDTYSPGEREHKEFSYQGVLMPGFVMLLILLVVVAAVICIFVFGRDYSEEAAATIISITMLLALFALKGFFVQEPNQARVMTFFGKYKGTCRNTGFYWINPLMERKKISLRICNMDVAPIKVNDLTGNPVLIGMVLVWKVCDTYRTFFDIDSQSFGAGSVNMSYLQSFVNIQADAALREVTGHFAYDDPEARPDGLTLRDGSKEISSLLETKINERLQMTGIEVVEARLNYLAYAPEIAAVMLKRQQASAVIAAREKIVEGAVSMVQMALDRIEKDKIAQLDARQRAAMVSNLLVVLCSEEPAQPVLNTSEA